MPAAGPGDKPRFGGAHHRMQDAFEPAQRLGLAEHPLAEALAIDAAGLVLHLREGRLDLPHRRAARRQQPVHHRIGVEQPHPEPPQHVGGRALAHADRTGEAENDHRGPVNVVRTEARNSRVTFTGLPNHASKPGRP